MVALRADVETEERPCRAGATVTPGTGRLRDSPADHCLHFSLDEGLLDDTPDAGT